MLRGITEASKGLVKELVKMSARKIRERKCRPMAGPMGNFLLA